MGMYEDLLLEKARREKTRREGSRTGTPDIIEETHDDVSWSDRAIVKNFSQSPQAAMKYLEQENPHLETKMYGGRILVKDKGASKWNVLDPEGFDIADISDIGYDVASGVAETAAFAGGGLASLPAGGIAAPLASGATAAASEGVRQGIGAGLGLDVDKGQLAKDVALSGAIGAAIPGVGKLAKPYVKPLIKKASGGAKKFISGLTEANADDIDVFINKGAQVDEILDSPEGFTKAYSGIREEIEDKVKTAKDELGQKFQELRASGVELNADNVVKVYDDKIAEIQSTMARGAGTPSDEALLKSLQAERNDLFSKVTPTKEISTTSTDYSNVPGKSLDDSLFVKPGEERYLGQPYKKYTDHMPREYRSEIKDTTGGLYPPKATEEIAEAATKGNVKTVKQQVAKEADVLMNQLTGKSSQAVKKAITERMDMQDAMNLRSKLASRANFKNKSQIQKSLDSADLSESLAARGYGELGKSIDDAAMKLGSKEAREQFSKHMEFIGDIAPHFKSTSAVETFMEAASKGKRKVLAEKIGKIDKKFNTDLSGKAKVLSTAQALKGYDSKTVVDVIRPRSILEMIGGAAGAKAAWTIGQPSLIPVTLAAGAAAGRKLGSIKAARRYVDFIVDVEGKALGLDEKAQEILRNKLYKSVTGENALRETIKTGFKLKDESENR